MASIFDNFSTLNMTPQEIKQLQLRQAAGGLMGTLEGEYIPRAEGIEDRASRPRLGVDPVAEQYGSRVDPNAKSGTMYGGRNGGPVSEDIDAARTKPSAATRWTPDGMPHPEDAPMRGSDFKGVPESRPLMEAADEVGKLAKFGRVASKALGPVGVLVDAASADEAVAPELTPEQEQEMARMAVSNMAPQVRQDAVDFAGGVADRAVNQAMGRGNPIDLRDPQAPRSNLFDQSRSPRQETVPDQPAVEETPVGPAVAANPQTAPQRVASQIQQREAAQQQIAQATTQQLSEGSLTRPAAAEAVVQADAQRKGVTLTPEQTKTAVASELESMKSMDNSQLGNYLSYALIAGGLIASFVDKSGETGQMFAQSFNKQLDRNLVEGQARRKEAAAKAKMEYEMAKDERDYGQKERDLQRKVGDSESRRAYQQEQTEIDREGLQIRRQGQAQSAAYNAARLAQGERGQDRADARAAQQQANWEKMFGFKEAESQARLQQGEERLRQADEANLIAATRAQAAANKGPGMTTKDAEAAIEATADAQGVKLDKAVVKAAGQQLRQHASNNAKAVQDNPTGIINQILQGSQYQVEPGYPRPFWFDKSPSVNLKQ